MNVRKANRTPLTLKSEDAQYRYQELKSYLWVVEYERPYPTTEVLFGDEESINRMKARGYAHFVASRGIQKASIHTIRPLTWEEFLTHYNIQLIEKSKEKETQSHG